MVAGERFITLDFQVLAAREQQGQRDDNRRPDHPTRDATQILEMSLASQSWTRAHGYTSGSNRYERPALVTST